MTGTTCTRCRQYTLFPPLCAECQKETQRIQERAERPAPTELPESKLLEVAAKELGMSPDALNRKIKKGNTTVTYETNVTVTRFDGSDPAASALRAQNYDALLRFANRRDSNASRLRRITKGLIALAVLYWAVRPLVQWLLR
jgi:hypothetical protein